MMTFLSALAVIIGARFALGVVFSAELVAAATGP
jgi:hypothetical protein